jgi:hypothetical protein
MPIVNHAVVIAAQRHTAATIYFARLMWELARFIIAVVVNMPIKYAMKLDATGNAILWQGYVARLGLGMTRIRNQIVANNPVRGHSHLSQARRGRTL